MKKLIFTLAIMAGALFSVNAQKTKTIKLEQTPGQFTETELTLNAGKAYVFEIKNSGVDHEVGFVLTPAGKTEAKHHVKEAYVTQTVKNGESKKSNVVVLEAGEYVYFCPLNPTPQYKITVRE
ncbi:MAG: cupredoxin domain-containing protein [Cyclobacteriaceae bacterium]